MRAGASSTSTAASSAILVDRFIFGLQRRHATWTPIWRDFGSWIVRLAA
jgi:hypothetical protein